jgi:hypothetical protein
MHHSQLSSKIYSSSVNLQSNNNIKKPSLPILAIEKNPLANNFLKNFIFNPESIKSRYWRIYCIILRHFFIYQIILNFLIYCIYKGIIYKKNIQINGVINKNFYIKYLFPFLILIFTLMYLFVEKKSLNWFVVSLLILDIFLSYLVIPFVIENTSIEKEELEIENILRGITEGINIGAIDMPKEISKIIVNWHTYLLGKKNIRNLANIQRMAQAQMAQNEDGNDINRIQENEQRIKVIEEQENVSNVVKITKDIKNALEKIGPKYKFSIKYLIITSLIFLFLCVVLNAILVFFNFYKKLWELN